MAAVTWRTTSTVRCAYRAPDRKEVYACVCVCVRVTVCVRVYVGVYLNLSGQTAIDTNFKLRQHCAILNDKHTNCVAFTHGNAILCDAFIHSFIYGIAVLVPLYSNESILQRIPDVFCCDTRAEWCAPIHRIGYGAHDGGWLRKRFECGKLFRLS